MPKSPLRNFDLFASTAPGLESIAAGELKRLGLKARQVGAQTGGRAGAAAGGGGGGGGGGVAFKGGLERIYETNLWLRTASRVLVRMGQFHASTFYELERRAKTLPWEDFLPASGPVRLRVTCRKSKLYHSDAVAERVLSAISRVAPRVLDVEAGGGGEEESGEEESNRPEKGNAQLFVVRIVDDQCEVSADSSGELLHRRGYRQEIAKAPLRETLAAAMVLASGWRSGEPLLDPMCGSGTIPIEAILIARGIAPGIKRRFQFMAWPGFDSARWNEILEKARGSVTELAGEIRGSDRDAGAIRAAMHNAERAGVVGDIEFFTDAISGSMAALSGVEDGAGWILTNPPYGIRVGDVADLRDLYGKLGSSLKAKDGWRLGILTSDEMLVRQTGLLLRPRFSTQNGGISVTFFATEKRAK
jgi:putative N6-adenine-specific DNA methylase